jgi:homoserine dehydrogenase
MSKETQTIGLLLMGFGSAAQGFLSLLEKRTTFFYEQLGVEILIQGIGTRKGLYILHEGMQAEQLALYKKPFQEFVERGEVCSDSLSFIQKGKEAGASIFVELTYLNPQSGQPAITHIQQALHSSLDVITANKGPIAYAHRELQKLASEHGVQLRFESAVMDGLPVFNLAQFTLPAVGIKSFQAILNSTTNIVLDMIEKGFTREDAIKEAQRLGIAEADPWYDLDGWDALMKTTILANTLLGGNLKPSDVKREGIRNLSTEAIQQAKQNDAPLHLVSRASRDASSVHAEVLPLPIPRQSILHVAEGLTNVFSLDTEAMGTITLVEHEPTIIQTGYGILSDLITVIRQREYRSH